MPADREQAGEGTRVLLGRECLGCGRELAGDDLCPDCGAPADVALDADVALEPTFVWSALSDGDFELVRCNRAAVEFTAGGVRHALGVRASALYFDEPEMVDALWRVTLLREPEISERAYRFRTCHASAYVIAGLRPGPDGLVLASVHDAAFD